MLIQNCSAKVGVLDADGQVIQLTDEGNVSQCSADEGRIDCTGK